MIGLNRPERSRSAVTICAISLAKVWAGEFGDGDGDGAYLPAPDFNLDLRRAACGASNAKAISASANLAASVDLLAVTANTALAPRRSGTARLKAATARKAPGECLRKARSLCLCRGCLAAHAAMARIASGCATGASDDRTVRCKVFLASFFPWMRRRTGAAFPETAALGLYPEFAGSEAAHRYRRHGGISLATYRCRTGRP